MSSNNFDRSNAVRLFAGELASATESVTFSDDEKAPTYQLLPSGGRAHRVFIVGTVTEVENVGSSSDYYKARVVDATGETFFVYAGEYQQDAAATLASLEAPEYLSVVGKTDTFEGDDGETYVSVTAEQAAVVDEATRDHWVVETAQQTIDRLEAFNEGEDVPGIPEDLEADLTALASETYDHETVEAVHEQTTAALESLQAEEAPA